VEPARPWTGISPKRLLKTAKSSPMLIPIKGYVKVNSAAEPSLKETKDENSPTPSSDTATATAAISAATPEQPEKALFPLPIILAGGLNPDNVAIAIAKVHPWSVDVSGGVENEAGTGKDMDKVKAFINNAKGLGLPPLDNSQEVNKISEDEEEEEEEA
jgi:phosphoribosylanthranilate isomerase